MTTLTPAAFLRAALTPGRPRTPSEAPKTLHGPITRVSEAISSPQWRCDVMATQGSTPKTSWHDTEEAAMRAERNAIKGGAWRAVGWVMG